MIGYADNRFTGWLWRLAGNFSSFYFWLASEVAAPVNNPSLSAENAEQSISPEEQILLNAVAAGDSFAFLQFYNRYRHVIYATVIKITKSHDTAEEMTQDVMLKIWEKRAELQKIRSLRSFLVAVTRNSVLDFLKNKKHRQRLLDRLSTGKASANLTEEVVAEKETVRMLNEAINRLSPRQQTAYRLKIEEGLSYPKIAQTMGLSVDTVKEHLKIASKKVRKYLNGKI